MNLNKFRYRKGTLPNELASQLLELGYTEQEIKERGIKKKIQTNSKKVVQLDLDNNIINIYDSLNEAGRVLGISSQNIGKVCKGFRQFCGGYRWKYLEDYEKVLT